MAATTEFNLNLLAPVSEGTVVDKQELYDAVLTDVIGGLMTRIQYVITAARTLPDAVDAALDAWVAGERAPAHCRGGDV